MRIPWQDIRILFLNRHVYHQALKTIAEFSPDIIYERTAFLNADGLKLARKFGPAKLPGHDKYAAG